MVNLAGLRAWIRWINDHGGLNGHPVNPLVVADDGGDAARNRQLAQQLIEDQKVVALAFDGALDGSGTVNYVTQRGVPFIGGIGTGQYFYESPVYFPQMPQSLALAQIAHGRLRVDGAQQRRARARVGERRAGLVPRSQRLQRGRHRLEPRHSGASAREIVGIRARESIRCSGEQRSGGHGATPAINARVY